MLEDKIRDTCVSFDLELLSSFQEFQHIMLPCSLELRERDRPAVHALISCNMSKLKGLANGRWIDIVF